MLFFEYLEYIYIVLPIALVSNILLYIIGYRKIFSRIHRAVNPLIEYISFSGERVRDRHRIYIELLSTIFIVLIVFTLANPYIEEKKIITGEEKGTGSLEFRARPPVILIIDVSGSMQGIKIEKAKEALKVFIEALNGSLDTGLIAFAEKIRIAIPPINDTNYLYSVIDSLEAGGGTMYSYPLELSYEILKPYHDLNISGTIVFASDGLPADKPQIDKYLDKLREINTTMYCIFIGKDVNGYNLLKEMANRTGGEAYRVTEVDKLINIYREIAGTIVNTTVSNITVKLQYHREVFVKQYLSQPLIYISLIVLSITYFLRWRRYRVTF